MSDHPLFSSEHEQIIETIQEIRHALHRPQIFAELDTWPRARLIELLNDLLYYSDEDVQETALRALIGMDASRAVDCMLPILSNPQSELRWFICYLLISFGDGRSVLPLVEVLQHDPDSDMRYMAASALKRTGDERALLALKQAAIHDTGMDYEGRRIVDIAQEAIATITARSSPTD